MQPSVEVRSRTQRARRPPRVVIIGEDGPALQCATGMAAARIADVVLAAETPGEARRASEALSAPGAIARVSLLLKDAAPCDLVVIFSGDSTRVRDVALWAARTCPQTVLIIAAGPGLRLSRDALRASGLAPNLILTTGSMPRARLEAARLAARLGVARAQVCIPLMGGDEPGACRVLHRYATVAGIPARAIDRAAWIAWTEEPAPSLEGVTLVPSALALARAVLLDRSEVHSCGAWVAEDAGMPGGFVAMPVRVGSRGAGGALPLKFTLEERAALQRQAVGL